MHYFGAGTSGRLAVLDAAELLPTFNAPAGLFVAHHAGGPAALRHGGRERRGRRRAGRPGRRGRSARATSSSASPPPAARRTSPAPWPPPAARGALTLLVTANPQAELGPDADLLLAVDTGPEVITGSTRLKAGTAQKLVLNGFSTAVMVRLGRTWSNLMVDVVATNAKLRGRVIRILREASGADEADRAGRARAGRRRAQAGPALAAGRGRARRARTALEQHDGSVAQALRCLQSPPGSAPHDAELHDSEPHGTAPHEQETSR